MAVIAMSKVSDGVTEFLDAVQWVDMQNTDTGQPLSNWFNKFPDKTVQAIGGAVTIQGSSDSRVISDPANAVWETLNDISGEPLVLADGDIKVILENPLYMRPLAGANNVTVTITGAK